MTMKTLWGSIVASALVCGLALPAAAASAAVPSAASPTRSTASVERSRPEPAAVVEHELELGYGSRPKRDLRLVGTMKTASTGATARVVYRFGRSAPRAAAPELGSEMVVGNTRVGRSIKMK
jgi:hypothetical protein